MPSESQSQNAVMAMSQTPEGRAKLRSYGMTPVQQSVAHEFTEADKGKHFAHLHVHKRMKQRPK